MWNGKSIRRDDLQATMTYNTRRWNALNAATEFLVISIDSPRVEFHRDEIFIQNEVVHISMQSSLISEESLESIRQIGLLCYFEKAWRAK